MDGRKRRPDRPAQCGLCSHPERVRIEALRAGGVSLRLLERQFAVSKDIVSRHFRAHVSPERKAELICGPAKVEQLANAAADESRGLLDYLQITRTVLFNQFLAAAEGFRSEWRQRDRRALARQPSRAWEADRRAEADLGRFDHEQYGQPHRQSRVHRPVGRLADDRQGASGDQAGHHRPLAQPGLASTQAERRARSGHDRGGCPR
jgi:hypothetical protein